MPNSSKYPLKKRTGDLTRTIDGLSAAAAASPRKLTEYAGRLVNEKPMPICWKWTTDEVNYWLKNTVGLPQYQDCISRNFINGRRLLLLLETFGLQKCGITDFSHIQRISAAIRELIEIERQKNDRSIGLPPRYPWTLYLMYRIPTGPSREATTPTQLFQMMGILDKSEPRVRLVIGK